MKSFRLFSVSVTVLLSLLLSACGTSSGSDTGGSGIGSDDDGPGKFDNGTTMLAIQQRGKLIVGLRGDAAPFSYKDQNTGSWQGLDVQVANYIARGIFGRRIENKVEFVEYNALDRELGLSQGKIDVALGRYAITVARKRSIDFAGPYFVNKQAVVTLDSQRDAINSLISLNGQTVCVVQGSTNVDALLEVAPQARPTLPQKSVNACAPMLQNGSAKAVVADLVAVKLFMAQAGSSIQMLDTTFADEPYGVGVKKGATDIRQYINDRLDGPYKEAYTNELKNAFDIDANIPFPQIDRY